MYGHNNEPQPVSSQAKEVKSSRDVQLLNFPKVQGAKQAAELDSHKNYKARRLLLFKHAVGCVAARGEIQFLDRNTRRRLPDLHLPPRDRVLQYVEDTATISKSIAVVAYTNVKPDSPYQASIIDFRDPNRHCRRFDLKERPHVHSGKSTKFGITALCAVSCSTTSFQFASGGCGGADKSIYLWTVKPKADNPAAFEANTVILPMQQAHTSAIAGLAYMAHKDYIMSAGRDCRLRITDLGAQKVTSCQLVEQGAEIYQLHVAPPRFDQNQTLLLCEMKKSKIVNVLDIRVQAKHIIQLGPKRKIVSSEGSMEKDWQTQYTRGYFTGSMFLRGTEIYDLRNAKQSIPGGSNIPVHTLLDPKQSTIMQYGGTTVTYFDFKK
ncbi:hypothetical protein FRB93_013377 [Tulasnella sp. JGI-2019a]|nr:hypothetical protein FRB93_013377 [Tulasnella sp. JGI-2019a]